MRHQPAPNLEVLLEQAALIRALARGLVRDAAAADDVVQEALLGALRRPGTVELVEGDAGGAWAARVMARLARTRARGEGRRARREAEGARAEAVPSAADDAIARERGRELIEAVLGLDEPYRTVVLLRYCDDVAPREIVRRTGQSVEAVKKQLQRGLAQLRARLEARLGGEGAWAVALLPLTGEQAVRTGALAALGDVGRRAALALALLGGSAFLTRALWRGTPERLETGRAITAALDAAPEREGAPAPLDPRGAGAAARASAAPRPADGERAEGRAPTADMARTTGAPPRFAPPFRARVVDAFDRPLSRTALAELTFEYRFSERGTRLFGEPSVVALAPDPEGQVASALVPDLGSGGLGRLDVARGPWSILKVGRRTRAVDVGVEMGVDPDDAETRIVLLPKVRIAGVVVDAADAPIPGIAVSVLADLEALGTYPGGLATTAGQRRWQTTTDEHGRFALANVPGSERFELVAGTLERGLARVALPTADRADLVLRIVDEERPGQVAVRGRVVEANGAPVKGARVDLGWLQASAADDGSFTFEATPSQLASIEAGTSQLSALTSDARFTRVEFTSARLADYVLRLPSAMARLSLQVLDPAGAPLPGASVFVYDGAPLGSSSLSLEDFRSGAVPVTDQDGRITLHGLELRPYVLRVIQAEPFLVFDTEVVLPAIDELTLRAPGDHAFAPLRGRALDLRGRPLAGIQVTPLAYQRAPGATRMAIRGRSATTDADGRFELPRWPPSGATLELDASPNDAGGRSEVLLEAGDLAQLVELTLDLECDFVPTLREGAIEGALTFHDAQGRAVRAKQVVPNGTRSADLVRQGADGTFGRLVVSQRATRVDVHDRSGNVLRSVELDLSPTRRTLLEL
ncbi:MAG: sigma-70 family RNA polymerase sigma factor [Planctomycetota bacterium]